MKYNIETIKQLCEPYGYTIRNGGYMLYVNKIRSEDEDIDKENWYKPEIFCKLVDDEYLENEYTIDRFAITFSGFGTLGLEEENKVMEYLKSAKELVDKLNAYIAICNKDAEIQAEKKFHNNREAFAYIRNNDKYMITFCSTPGLSHKEWLIDMLGYSEEEFNNTVRGFRDKSGIYFYIGDFETNDDVERIAKHYKEFYSGGQKVYCGMIPGKIGERWKPMKEI